MAILTEEAKEAVERKVDESIRDFKHTIFVLNTYKWIFGIVLALMGIGTYLGIDALIEKKVNARIKNYDEFMNAEAHISKSQYEKSYELMKTAWKDFKGTGISSPSLKEMYYNDMITILSNMTTYDKHDRKFVSAQTLKELNEDKGFLDLLDNFKGNYYSRIDVSCCKIKFDDSATAWQELNKLETISETPDMSISTHGETEYIDRLWFPFMANVIKKDKIKAIAYRDLLLVLNDNFFNRWKINDRINGDHINIIYWANINNKINHEKDTTFIARLEDILKIGSNETTN
jgi:hypothetical protein